MKIISLIVLLSAIEICLTQLLGNGGNNGGNNGLIGNAIGNVMKTGQDLLADTLGSTRSQSTSNRFNTAFLTRCARTEECKRNYYVFYDSQIRGCVNLINTNVDNLSILYGTSPGTKLLVNSPSPGTAGSPITVTTVNPSGGTATLFPGAPQNSGQSMNMANSGTNGQQAGSPQPQSSGGSFRGSQGSIQVSNLVDGKSEGIEILEDRR